MVYNFKSINRVVTGRSIIDIILLLLVKGVVQATYCPDTYCVCHFDHQVSENAAICRINNGTIDIKWASNLETQYRPVVTITCQDIEDFECFEFPKYDIRHYRMKVVSCPTSLLRCGELTTRTTIEKLEASYLYGTYISDHLSDLNSVKEIRLILRDAAPLPIPAIQVLPVGIALVIKGGNFELPSKTFRNMPPLKELDLESNNISRLLLDSLDGLSCKNLRILDNNFENITAGSFDGVNNLQNLILYGNNIKHIEPGAFASPSLRKLCLEKSLIEFLPNGLLNGLNNLIEMRLLSNKLDITLDSHVFSQLPASVNTIELYGTKINNLKDTLFSGSSYLKVLKMHKTKVGEMPLKIFWELPMLTILNLNGNNLKYIPEGLFAKLTNLECLHLNYNQLTTLTDDQFTFSPKLTEMFLNHNKLTSVNLNSFGSNLVKLSLIGNGLENIEGDTKIMWQNMQTLRFAANNFSSFEDLIYGLTKVTYVDFSRNKITSIKENKTFFLSTKAVLDLSWNQITYVIEDTTPFEPTGRHLVLNLSSNPLRCDCSQVRLYHEWNKAGLLLNFEDITCDDDQNILLISNIDPVKVCKQLQMFIVMVGTSIVGGLVLFVILITLIWNWKRIWEYIMETCQSDISNESITIEMGPDSDKIYDVFISYAQQDEQFVTDKLISNLEFEFGLKICVRYKDWVVSDLISEQIKESVHSSKMTIIILTDHFIESECCNLEFRTAYELSIEDGKPRVITILLDESVTKNERLSSNIKTYISVNTYLVWDDPKFWEKLKKVLPKNDKRDVTRRY